MSWSSLRRGQLAGLARPWIAALNSLAAELAESRNGRGATHQLTAFHSVENGNEPFFAQVVLKLGGQSP